MEAAFDCYWVKGLTFTCMLTKRLFTGLQNGLEGREKETARNSEKERERERKRD